MFEIQKAAEEGVAIMREVRGLVIDFRRNGGEIVLDLPNTPLLNQLGLSGGLRAKFRVIKEGDKNE